MLQEEGAKGKEASTRAVEVARLKAAEAVNKKGTVTREEVIARTETTEERKVTKAVIDREGYPSVRHPHPHPDAGVHRDGG